MSKSQDRTGLALVCPGFTMSCPGQTFAISESVKVEHIGLIQPFNFQREVDVRKFSTSFETSQVDVYYYPPNGSKTTRDVCVLLAGEWGKLPTTKRTEV